MKILLINPPMHNIIKSNVPSIVDEESGYYPPLGLMYVAACAEKNTDSKIEILDTIVERMSYDQIGQEIERKKPDVVGIQALTFTLIDAILTAKMVKEIDDEIKVVMGGPHVNIYPYETISLEEVDYLVLGEGEISFTDLLKNIDN
ncbi:MAG: cobalamin-dependent protein, partial [Proteobacteria bacterium]|nr:cobalamin-dependent protein [Pseudomonadota bacterium]